MADAARKLTVAVVASAVSALTPLILFLAFLSKLIIITSYVDQLRIQFLEPFLMVDGNYIALFAAAFLLVFCFSVFSGVCSALLKEDFSLEKAPQSGLFSDISLLKRICFLIFIVLYCLFWLFFWKKLVGGEIFIIFVAVVISSLWFSEVEIAKLSCPNWAALDRLCYEFDLKTIRDDVLQDGARGEITFFEQSTKQKIDKYINYGAFFNLYGTFFYLAAVYNTKIGLQKINFWNAAFISLIAILLPNLIAVWSFEVTRRYFRARPLRWVMFGVLAPISAIFVFLAITSSTYSLMAERVMFMTNLGYNKIQFVNSQYLRGALTKKNLKQFCIIASDSNYYYLMQVKNINHQKRTIGSYYLKVEIPHEKIETIFNNIRPSGFYRIESKSICPPVTFPKMPNELIGTWKVKQVSWKKGVHFPIEKSKRWLTSMSLDITDTGIVANASRTNDRMAFF